MKLEQLEAAKGINYAMIDGVKYFRLCDLIRQVYPTSNGYADSRASAANDLFSKDYAFACRKINGGKDGLEHKGRYVLATMLEDATDFITDPVMQKKIQAAADFNVETAIARKQIKDKVEELFMKAESTPESLEVGDELPAAIETRAKKPRIYHSKEQFAGIEKMWAERNQLLLQKTNLQLIADVFGGSPFGIRTHLEKAGMLPPRPSSTLRVIPVAASAEIVATAAPETTPKPVASEVAVLIAKLFNTQNSVIKALHAKVAGLQIDIAASQAQSSLALTTSQDVLSNQMLGLDRQKEQTSMIGHLIDLVNMRWFSSQAPVDAPPSLLDKLLGRRKISVS